VRRGASTLGSCMGNTALHSHATQRANPRTEANAEDDAHVIMDAKRKQIVMFSSVMKGSRALLESRSKGVLHAGHTTRSELDSAPQANGHATEKRCHVGCDLDIYNMGKANG
jgi:hypothetical protein